MRPRILLDENLRGPLPAAIEGYNRQPGHNPIDAVTVGDHPEVPSGTVDSILLEWAWQEGRVLVTADRKTMPDFFYRRLKSGERSAGVAVVPKVYTIAYLLDYLVTLTGATEAEGWVDRIHFL